MQIPRWLAVALSRGVLLGTLALLAGFTAQAATVLWYQTGGSPPQVRTMPTDGLRVFASPASLAADNTVGEYKQLSIRAPFGANLDPGAYEEAQGWGYQTDGAAISFGPFGITCPLQRGRFVVHEFELDSSSNPVRLSVDFEIQCIGGELTFGELRFNSDVALTVDKPAGGTRPDAFAFNRLLQIAAGATAVSGPTTVYGVNAATPVAISGGTYSVNGGPFTSAPGLVGNRDQLRVSLQASAAPGATASATLTVGGLAATFDVTTANPGQPITALWFDSAPGEYIGSGDTLAAYAPDWLATASRPDGKGIDARFTHSAGSSPSQVFGLEIRGRNQAAVALGAYEETANAGVQGTSPGLNFNSTGKGCSQTRGRFVVLDLDVAIDGTVNRLAVDFEQTCDQIAAPLYGELRYRSAVPLTFSKPANSTAPDPFAFNAVQFANPGAILVSNQITIYGTNAPSPISIAGGEYSVNGGIFTSSPGLVNPRDHVKVRAVAPSAQGATAAATLTVGGVNAAFNVTTFATGPFTAFAYASQSADEFMGNGATLEGRAPDWTVTAVRRETSGIGMSIRGPLAQEYLLMLDAPSGSTLAPGAYEGAVVSGGSRVLPGLYLQRAGRACGTVSGRFVVLDVDFGAGTTVNRFAADFEQWCDGKGPLYGEIRFNSALPLTAMKPPGSTLADAFAFHAQSPVRPGEVIVSNPIRIYGVNAPVAVSVSGGEYSINGAPFTSAPGTARNLDQIEVRLTASAVAGAVSSATLDAAGRSATLSVTTYAPGMALSGIMFRRTDMPANSAYTYYGTGVGVDLPHNYANEVTVNVYGPLLEVWTAYLTQPAGAALGLGAQDQAASWMFAGASPFKCSTSTEGPARYLVRDIAYAPDGSVQRLAVDLETQCGNAGAPTAYVELRANSTVPISYFLATSPAPVLTSPAPGSTLSDSRQRFEWPDAPARVQFLIVGSTPGGSDIGVFPTEGTLGTSALATNLPTDGRTLYVRLVSIGEFDDSVESRDYTFTAAPVAVAAELVSPAPGSRLAGSTQLFEWSAAAGASLYQLWIGNTAGANDIGSFPASGTSATSVSVSGLPVDGRTLYVQLRSLAGGTYFVRDYVLLAKDAPPVPSEITTPAPGSTFTSSTMTFTWTSGTNVADRFLMVGTSPGAADIYSGYQGAATSRTVSGLPSDGRPVYVWLQSLIKGSWERSAYTYTAFTAVPSAITSPAPGSILPGATVTFSWTVGSGVTDRFLAIGTAFGGQQVYAASQGLHTSVTVSGIPIDGSVVYVRLRSLIDGTWLENDYAYRANQPAPSLITSPAPGSSLSATSVEFSWSAGSLIADRYLAVGTSLGGSQIYGGNQGAATSRTVSGLPSDGSTVFVRLVSFTDAGALQANDYTYTAVDTRPVASVITAPAPFAALGSTVTFSWSAGNAITANYLTVGTTPGGSDIYGAYQNSMSRTVTGIPQDGRTIYVRLRSYSPTIGWLDQSYTYTALMPAPSALTSPVPGSTLNSSSITFGWSAGTAITANYLMVGTTPGGAEIYGGYPTGLSQAVTGIPQDGRTVYVRLMSYSPTGWVSVSYTFRGGTAAAPPAPAVMTSPTPGSTLTSASVTFAWTAGTGSSATYLMVGTTAAGSEIYSGYQASLSQIVNGIPQDGRAVYVRLMSYISGGWQSFDYTYIGGTAAAPSVMTSPAAGSALPTPATFTWSAGSGSTASYLMVGTTVGGAEVYSGYQALLSQTVNNIPQDGRTVYVRLMSYINAMWQSNDYVYTGGTGSGGGSTTPSVITSPTAGSALGTFATFVWSSGSGITARYLMVGSTVGGTQYYQGYESASSRTVSGLPGNGAAVYVRLMSYINGNWQTQDYAYH